MIKALVIVVFGLTFGALLLQGAEPNPDKEYCHMVDLYKKSAGEIGWQAYKGEEMCRDENND